MNEHFSIIGEEISASFTITSSLSNVSRLTLTDGADGNDGHR